MKSPGFMKRYWMINRLSTIKEKPPESQVGFLVKAH